MRLLIAIVAAWSVACSGAPLPNSHESVESLGRAVLAAVERHDADALRALALDRIEFTEHVWAELPAAQPNRNLSAGYVWGDLNQKSNTSLKRLLAEHGGKTYTLHSVRFLGDTTQYDTYLVHRESELTVMDADGTTGRLRLFGSVIEKNNRYKVFSYVIDD
jgi:hypothetical protein